MSRGKLSFLGKISKLTNGVTCGLESDGIVDPLRRPTKGFYLDVPLVAYSR